MIPRLICALLMSLTMIRAEVSSAETTSLPDEIMIGGVEFVRIPAGEFWYVVWTDYRNNVATSAAMRRDVKVWLDDYYIAKYEARARDFVRYMNSPDVPQDFVADPQHWLRAFDACAVEYQPGIGFRERYPDTDLPATNVTWELANDFSRWMGFRLPTEAEWQKAARGTDRRIWPWGDDYPDDTYANYAYSAGCDPAPVTTYPKGRSPYGVYNMAGNVAEPTANWFNLDLDRSLVNGARNPEPPREPVLNDEIVSEFRIVVGGRWPAVPGGIAIGHRALSRPGNSIANSGVRFAVSSAVVRARLEDGTATVLLEKRL